MRTLRGKNRVALITAAAIAMAASSAGFSASTASAAPPVAVSIEFTVTQFTPTSFGGVWQASGAINDSGSFARMDVNFTGSVPNSPVVGAFQSVLVLSSSQGTLTVMQELRFTLSGATGVWEIASGTGAYERVSGHGIFNFVSPTNFIDTGVISTAR